MKAIITQLSPHLTPLRQAWQARPADERRRLIFGLGIMALLGGYLLIKHWPAPDTAPASPSSPSLDQALRRLPPQPQLTPKQWQAAASNSGIVIQRIEQQQGWQLSGLLTQPQDFQQLSRWAAQQGLWPYTYQLTRETEGWQWQAHFIHLQDWLSLEAQRAASETSTSSTTQQEPQ